MAVGKRSICHDRRRWRVMAMSVVVSAPRAHWQVAELEFEEIDQPWRIAKAPPPATPPKAVEEQAQPAASRGLGGLLGGKSQLGQIGGALVSELTKGRIGQTQAPPKTQAKMPAPLPRPVGARARSAPLPAPVPAKVVMVPSRAEISTRLAIGNAFTIRAEVEPVEGGGRIVIGPYQGARRNDGYRLSYAPSGRPWLALSRLSRQGATVVDSIDRPAAGDSGVTHVFKWARSRDGAMTVSIDGHAALRAVDRGYRDAFSGLAIVNEGGDFILGSIAIEETR